MCCNNLSKPYTKLFIWSTLLKHLFLVGIKMRSFSVFERLMVTRYFHFVISARSTSKDWFSFRLTSRQKKFVASVEYQHRHNMCWWPERPLFQHERAAEKMQWDNVGDWMLIKKNINHTVQMGTARVNFNSFQNVIFQTKKDKLLQKKTYAVK